MGIDKIYNTVRESATKAILTISPLKKGCLVLGLMRKELSLQTEKGVSKVAPCNNQRQVNLRYLAAPFLLENSVGTNYA